MDMREKQLSCEYFFEGRIMKARLDQALLPNGKTAPREVCEHVGGVGVLPIDRDGNIILVRQFRYPYGEEILEIPAGKLDPGESESAAGCGARELRGEPGCTGGRIVPPGGGCPPPGGAGDRGQARGRGPPPGKSPPPPPPPGGPRGGGPPPGVPGPFPPAPPGPPPAPPGR